MPLPDPAHHSGEHDKEAQCQADYDERACRVMRDHLVYDDLRANRRSESHRLDGERREYHITPD